MIDIYAGAGDARYFNNTIVDNKANEDRCTCEEGGREEAPCPYQCEVNEADDDQAYCRCCPYCRQQCRDSI